MLKRQRPVIKRETVRSNGVDIDNAPNLEVGDFCEDAEGVAWWIYAMHHTECYIERYVKLPDGVVSLHSTILFKDELTHTPSFIYGWIAGFNKSPRGQWINGHGKQGAANNPSLKLGFNNAEAERGYLRGERRREFFDYCKHGSAFNLEIR